MRVQLWLVVFAGSVIWLGFKQPGESQWPATGLAASAVPAGGVQALEACSVFHDFWEMDLIFDDKFHQFDGYPHPEVTNPWGEWELSQTLWADGRTHGLAVGWTLDMTADYSEHAHHEPCGPA